jgi:hypothetical protein
MADLLIENQNLVYDSVPSFAGYNITRNEPTDFTWTNNYFHQIT